MEFNGHQLNVIFRKTKRRTIHYVDIQLATLQVVWLLAERILRVLQVHEAKDGGLAQVAALLLHRGVIDDGAKVVEIVDDIYGEGVTRDVTDKH